MAKYTARQTKQKYELNDGNFKAKGGEGSIYIVGDTVCKICEDGSMIPEAKFQELAVLDHPRIIRPEDILLNSRKKAVGYTMRLVPGNAMPLAQILTKTYREREGVTPDHMMNLVSQIGDGLRFVHSHNGYLQVDGNELNYMVTDDHKEAYFIDVNSFQTPSFPADAIMASIRDYSVQQDASGNWPWSPLSDWYSFAIISWYMFTAIHPFKGMNPNFPDRKTYMVDQMRANVSVLDKDTEYPLGAVYHPFEDVIPGGKDGAYMQWYRAIFMDGKRLPAPESFQATIAFVAKVKEIVGSDNFIMTVIKEFADPIVQHYVSKGKMVIATTNNLVVDNKTMPRPAGKFRIGFTPKNNKPIMIQMSEDDISLHDLEAGHKLRFTATARDIMSCEGRLYLLGGNEISEVDFVEAGTTIATIKPVAQIMPNATQMFQGVAIQDMLGSLMASIFPAKGHHRQFRLKELGGFQVTDAKYENHVLMVVAMNRSDGEYTRFIFRFKSDWSDYDCRTIEGINPAGLNFTVTDKGICICLTEEEKIELFSNQVGSSGVKSVDDPAVVADMRLCHSGNEVRFAHGKKLYTFAMK